MRYLWALLTACCVWLPLESSADQPLELIRIACIPEMRYIEIENKAYPSEATTWIWSGFEIEEENKELNMKKRWNILKKQGLYPPENLKYRCELAGSIYELNSSKGEPREKGMCGAAPTATISLRRDGKEWISNVLFGDDCFNRPSIESIAVFEGKQGWEPLNMTVCFRSNQPGVPGGCKYLSETYGAVYEAIPITQEKLASYLDKAKKKE